MKAMTLLRHRCLLGCMQVALLICVICLTGCASNTRAMADSINPNTDQYKDAACQRSFELATLHDDIKLTRTIATPSLLLLTGGAYLIPLIGVNMGLDALDHIDASHVSKVCGGFATPSENILEKVLLGASFGALKKN
jgi:hypothetical protein